MQEQYKAGLQPSHHSFIDEPLSKNLAVAAGILLVALLNIIASTQPAFATVDVGGGTGDTWAWSDHPFATHVIASASGTLDSVGLGWSGAFAGGNIAIGIYSDGGAKPDVRLGSATAAQSASTGIQNVSIAGVSITAGTHYWLVANPSDGRIIIWGVDAVVAGRYYALAYPNLDNPWNGADMEMAAGKASLMVMTYTPTASSSSTIAVNITSPTNSTYWDSNIDFSFNVSTSESDRVLYIPFYEGGGTTVKDVSGSGYNGAMTNMLASAWTNGNNCRAGRCLTFDSVDDYVDVGDKSGLNITGSAMTLSACINTPSVPVALDREAIMAKLNSGGQAGYLLGINTDGTVRFSTGNGSVNDYDTTNKISFNTMQCIAAVYNGTHKIIYVNGSMWGTNPAAIGNLQATINKFGIGTWFAPAADKIFSGTIDEVYVFNTALNSTQISNLHSKGLHNALRIQAFNSSASSFFDNSSWSGFFEHANLTFPMLKGIGYQYARVNASDISTSAIQQLNYTVADLQVVSTYSDAFVPETNDSIFIMTAHYNPDLITSIISTLNWNGTDQPQTAQTVNATHIISFVNYTIPLIWANNTEIDFFISNLITAANASTPRLNGSAIKQNITYIAWIDSVATDSANYLEGEAITGYLYAKVNGARPTLRAQLDLRYNDTRNITQTIAAYTGTTTRTYEYVYPFHAPSANSENITLNGTFDVSYGGRMRSKNTTVNATVVKLFITNCSEGAPTIMLDFRNETDFGLATGYIPLIYFNLTSGIISRQYSFANLTENRTFTFCLSPSWSHPTANIFIRYLSASAPERQYFLNGVHLTSTKETVYPFLLNSTFAYYTNIFVYNQNNARIPNAYVRVLKMNPATAAYETMFIGRTDSEGVMPTFLYPLTQPYKFYILDSNNSVLYMTEAENIPCISGSCPPYEKHIYTTAALLGYVSFQGITSTVSWSNSTRTVSVNVLDAAGISQSVWLRIWALNEFGGKTLYYQSVSNTSTLAYSAVLPNTTSQYHLSVMVEENDAFYSYIDETLNVYQIERFGTMGIILGAFIVCALMVSGYYAADLIGGVIGGYVGLWLCSGYGLQLIPVDATGLAAIGIVLAIIGYGATR